MIDQNRDGFIDKEDLHDMLASLGNVTFLFMFAKQICAVIIKIIEFGMAYERCLSLYYTIRITFSFSLKAKPNMNPFICRKESNG